MIKYYLIIIGIFCSMASSSGQQVTLLSLNDCMDYAVKHNYAIKNAQLDVLIQHAQVAETLAAAYPHINGKAEFDDFYVPQYSLLTNTVFIPEYLRALSSP